MTIRQLGLWAFIILLLSFVNGYDPVIEELLDPITGRIVNNSNTPISSVSITSIRTIVDENGRLSIDTSSILNSTLTDDMGNFTFDSFLIEKWHDAEFGCWGIKSTSVEARNMTFAMRFVNPANETFCIVIADTTGRGEYSLVPIDTNLVDSLLLADYTVLGEPLTRRTFPPLNLAF